MPEVDLRFLCELLEVELRSKELGKIPKTVYHDVASYIRSTRNYVNQKDESIAERLRNREKELMKTVVIRLLNLRLKKARLIKENPEINLVAEERYSLEASTQAAQRNMKVQSAIVNGQTAILVSIYESQAKKTTTVRILKPLVAIVGVDLKKYGPFQPEDIATLPFENVRPLVSQGVVAEVWLRE